MERVILCALLIYCFFSCIDKSNADLDTTAIYAWCIVPYDKLNRTPEQRIEMLKDLGITKYAYDWRMQDLKNMQQELLLAKENNINIFSVWLWIDGNWDTPQKLNDSNQKMFQILEQTGYQGELWVSFHNNYFEGLAQEEALIKGVKMIEFLSEKAETLDCKIALYNHGDWFGDPLNQLQIIKQLPNHDIGMVYNFHHAHQQIDEFYEFVPKIMPYLWHVNLSGLKKEGPKILPIGKGDHEKEMIKFLLKNNYKNDFGILGHVEDKDVKLVLKENFEGLKHYFRHN